MGLRRVRNLQYLMLALLLATPSPALASGPDGLVQATAAITAPTIEMETGELYEFLMETTGDLFEPQVDLMESIYELYTSIVLDNNPVTTGFQAQQEMRVVWSYFNYFQNLLPGLMSLAAVIAFFLLVISVKILASILLFIWKFIPLKFT